MNEFHGIGVCDTSDMKKNISFHYEMKTPNSFLGGGETLGMVVMLDKYSILTRVPHSTSKDNKVKMLEIPSILACSYY